MITVEEVKKLASLARLQIAENEQEKLRGDLSRILEYVGQIKEVSGVRVEDRVMGPVNSLREDANPHASGEFSETLLKAAPEREKNYFKVRKILTRE